ncbi:hypothetical protein [Phenylobacterium sp.]|uniref:hypothetical protein n=1 Tax=Phenylobacterium sp. TaxID=1871053 RepID=UPI002DE3CD93|nr:hypothetical protein [Phenylobacterium sp.]
MTVKRLAASLLACALLPLPAAAAGVAQARGRTAAPPPGQAAYVAPRTASGQPSLEGVWASNALLLLESTPRTPELTVPEPEAKALASAAAEAQAAGLDRALDPEAPAMLRATDGFPRVRGVRHTRLVVEPADGKIPYTPQARREAMGLGKPPSYDNPEDRPPVERCLVGLGAPPLTMLNYANRLQILQTRDHVVLHVEYGDDVRIIPFSATHGPPFKSQLGDSIARWEGDTLVIETVGLSDTNRRRLFPTLIVPGDSKVIERLTRVSKTELVYQFTIIDPKTFTAPWLAEFSWFQTPQPMFEHACHEGNYSLPNILAGARQEEAAKAAAQGTKAGP